MDFARDLVVSLLKLEIFRVIIPSVFSVVTVGRMTFSRVQEYLPQFRFALIKRWITTYVLILFLAACSGTPPTYSVLPEDPSFPDYKLLGPDYVKSLG